MKNPFLSARRILKSSFVYLIKDINAKSPEAELNPAPVENVVKPCGEVKVWKPNKRYYF